MKHISYKHILVGGLAASVNLSASSWAAETQTPVFYGKINAALEQQDTEGAANLIQGKVAAHTDQWELNSYASRLGVKGAYDLEDSGLTAIYQAEYEINVDDGGSGDTAFNQRNIFAGLRGGFGEIRYGKFDTPLKAAEGKVDQFNDLKGDLDNLIGGQNRVSNIIQYSSPTLANTITLNAAFIPAEGADVDQDGEADTGIADSVSLSVVFDNKTFYAALAYDQDQAARRSLDGIKRGDLLRLVGGWKTGPLELGVLLQQVTDNVDASDKKDTSYLLSGAFVSGQFKYKTQYGFSEGNTTNEQGTLTSLGVDYALTSKANLYIYWSSLNLDQVDLNDKTFGIGTSFTF